MNDSIQIFCNPQFGEIRTTLTADNKPMFCLADVCKALELTNPAMVKSRLSAKGISNADTPTAGGVQSMIYINEANLYKCIFQSRKPEAEKFQDWVYEEVLPAIRKHGAYMTPAAIEQAITNPDFIIQLATSLKEERIKRLNAEAESEAQKQKIEADAPKVLFAEAVAESPSACLVSELAKILTQNGYQIGQNRLFKKLRDEGYLGRYGQYRNIPQQKYVEQGLFSIKKETWTSPSGTKYAASTTIVTGKGQLFFVEKFLNKSKTNNHKNKQ